MSLRRAVLLLAPLPLLAVPLVAQQMPTEAPGKPDTSRVAAGTYKLDPDHALIGWRVDHLGFSDYFGIFGSSTGTLVLDPQNLAVAKVEVTIPVSKVLTAHNGLTDHLLRPGKDGGKPDFFGANPADARFVSTKVTPGSDGTSATIVGDLTLNGQTHPVTLATRFNGAGAFPGGKPTVGFHARATISRSQWGISTGVPLVGDAVELDISAPLPRT
ncbi:MAG: YceI family protein [Novosphingobium sp.]|nr:YceI family protein [Novosphingobium sp.]